MTKPTHSNKYRLAFHLNSQNFQLYFHSYEKREEARKFIDDLKRSKAEAGFVCNTVKSKNAKSKDLPVGITEVVGFRSRKGEPNQKETLKGNPCGSISTLIKVDGKYKRRAFGYGDKRTRDEAIRLTIQARLGHIASLPGHDLSQFI